DRRPRPAREPGWRRSDLQVEVKMPFSRSHERLHATHLRGAHPDLRCGACPSLLLLAGAPCAPVHEHTAGAQERRRILDYDGLRAHRAGGRDVVAALTRAPLLGPPAHDARVLQPELADRA